MSQYADRPGSPPPVAVAIGEPPPRRSRITGALAALACAACCALPLLVAAGVLTGAGAAVAEKALLALAALLAAATLGMWWLHRRRATPRGCGCGSEGCGS